MHLMKIDPLIMTVVKTSLRFNLVSVTIYKRDGKSDITIRDMPIRLPRALCIFGIGPFSFINHFQQLDLSIETLFQCQSNLCPHVTLHTNPSNKFQLLKSEIWGF